LPSLHVDTPPLFRWNWKKTIASRWTCLYE